MLALAPGAIDTLRYRIMYPPDFDSTESYPLVVFLHGAGERGSDNEKQLTHGSSLFTSADVRERYHPIVVFPQCPQSDYWSNVIFQRDTSGKRIGFTFQDGGEPTPVMRSLMSWFDEFTSKPYVQLQRVYVMGLSMGGMGTFELMNRKPNAFAAAIPICGGANPAIAKSIRRIPMWIFHGAADPIVPSKFSEDMIVALQQYYDAADMQFTLYPGVGHNSWENVFKEPDLLPWLFGNVKPEKTTPR